MLPMWHFPFWRSRVLESGGMKGLRMIANHAVEVERRADDSENSVDYY